MVNLVHRGRLEERVSGVGQFYIDLLAERGPLLGEPYTRQLAGKLRELRFRSDGSGRSGLPKSHDLCGARGVRSIESSACIAVTSQRIYRTSLITWVWLACGVQAPIGAQRRNASTSAGSCSPAWWIMAGRATRGCRVSSLVVYRET